MNIVSGMNRGLEAILWGLAAKGLSPTAFRVLLRLCARVNGEDSRSDFAVWPAHKMLAEEAEVSASTVKRYLKELENGRFVIPLPLRREDNSQSVNLYILMVRGAQTPMNIPKSTLKSLGLYADLPVAPLGQSDLPPSSALNCPPGQLSTPPQFTAEPCNEPSNPTSEIKETPLSYGKDTPVEEKDLFGQTREEIETDRRAAIIDAVAAEWVMLSREVSAISGVRKIDDDRRKIILQRANEHASDDLKLTDVWPKIFAEIRASHFLKGLANPGRDRSSPFVVSLSWLLKRGNFRKVIEGDYRDKTGGNEHFDPTTGRKLAAHDIARNRINERLSRSQQRAESRTDQTTDAPRRLGYSSPSGR